jgi:hypothetical protein
LKYDLTIGYGNLRSDDRTKQSANVGKTNPTQKRRPKTRPRSGLNNSNNHMHVEAPFNS